MSDSPPSPNASSGGNRSRRGLIIAVAAVLVVAVLLAVWGVRNSQASSVGEPSPVGPQESLKSSSVAPSAPSSSVSSSSAAPSASSSSSATSSSAASTTKPTDSASLSEKSQAISEPVKPGSTTKVSQGVSAGISPFVAVAGVANGPGEVSGPSVQFTVTIKNETSKAINTSNVVVNVNAGPDESPAITLSGPGVKQFPETVAPGQSGSAVYVFLIPENLRSVVRVYVNYQVNSTIAAFVGAAPSTEG